ncbi:hypothetical protein OTU49_005712 [Cherax quadricarinatus]|uniref:Uncharacterized protein n=1 Tax=Cherax quadricarinatus TaxID=27406 RepID=A0AAW0X6S8_CHEQU|nr:D-beta-hydroxybutyrate dehydrogenase, mitochondrial-like [Cherax quadricarinatus]XP_053644501.1 D-beta-hydroxybutyrate dehydrogenase, mitochondrial-like [Cherax quadricarinatus]XP_053644503.1 D-beta-hydroxybutyrate dehydrogenase, mitochondrial-like [Cherax quadricarinatus]
MAWSYDRTGDVVFWGLVSGVVAASLHVLNICCPYIVFPAVWLLTAAASLTLSTLTVSPSGKAVLVTGCDSGFGHAFALILDKMGFRVFAGCLQAGGAGADLLREKGSNRLHVLQMDITNQEQVKQAAQDVERLLPGGEVLWGVVNNAGVLTYGMVEWVPLHTYISVANINIFGVISVTKTFLPLIRLAKGRVVIMSSVAGSIGRGLMSPYATTKFAVEGFSDCLREEMRPWGVRVTVVEPGNFSAATNITSKEKVSRQSEQMWAAMDPGVQRDYGKQFFDAITKLALIHTESGSKDETPVMQAMTEALTQRFPRARYRAVDWYYFIKLQAVIHLPEWFIDLIYIGQPPQKMYQENITQQKQD